MSTVRIERNDVTGILEAHIPARLTRLPVMWRSNVKGTEYGLCEAIVEYPNGSKATVNGVLYKGSLDTDLFHEDMDIILRTQVEGEYVGNSVVQLPGARRVDVSLFQAQFAEQIKAMQAEGMPAVKQTA